MTTSSFDFYTNVAVCRDKVLLRGIRDGVRVEERIPFRPTLFLESKSGETKYTSLDGKYLEPVKPGSIPECRDFCKQYRDVGGFNIYGNTDYVYQYIGESYRGDIDYDLSMVSVAYIDIETESEYGFPKVEESKERVNAISMDVGDTLYVFGLGDFHIEGADKQYNCETEEELLFKFIEVWKEERPDIITGWNVRFFDIPYLVNRIGIVLGSDAAKSLSPWGLVKEKTVKRMSREQQCYEIIGVSTLDYYELYQTFTYVNQESYRLDHIAFVELGEKKLSYDEYDSITSFYKRNFQKFMEYNVKDTLLIKKLEDKMKLLELAVSLAYSAKVNYMDVFGQVRTWDCIIYHYLMDHNVVIPPKSPGRKDTQYAGAYVKEPIVGMHDWVVSFDLNSLYPHLIMQYNISPETKIDMTQEYGITPNSILSGGDIGKKALGKCKANDYSVAANGTCYTKDYKGFLPSLMEKLYKERKMYKKKMIECQKRQQLGEDMSKDISKYHNFQLVRKIQLNSAYGAIGNEWFRYYDVEMAEAITLSGQLSIRWIADKLNGFLNKTIGTENYDYVVASDTDSVYLRLGNLVDKVCPNKGKEGIVNFLDKASEEIILPFIKKQYDELAGLMNAYENKMVMDRECISDKAVWTAKKRYMMHVYDSEGVRYETPKIKIMGIETTRSSTPQVVRDSLTEAIKLVLTTDEQTVIEFISNFREKFYSFTPEDIAFPRGVNGLEKYKDSTKIYRKSTPIAVKGSLIYNYYIDNNNLGSKYRNIIDGDKIKFLLLKKPNPLGGISNTDQVIAFPNSLPKEFGLENYIDYETMFSKSFLDPLKNILDKVGWNHEKKNTLEGLFI